LDWILDGACERIETAPLHPLHRYNSTWQKDPMHALAAVVEVHYCTAPGASFLLHVGADEMEELLKWFVAHITAQKTVSRQVAGVLYFTAHNDSRDTSGPVTLTHTSHLELVRYR